MHNDGWMLTTDGFIILLLTLLIWAWLEAFYIIWKLR